MTPEVRPVRIYVAGAYSASSTIDVLENIRRGILKCAELLELGFAPFCPWLDFMFAFFNPRLTITDYYRYSMAWLEVSEAVFVLKGSDRSVGTIAEVKHAKELGIPVTFEDDMDSLEEFLKRTETK